MREQQEARGKLVEGDMSVGVVPEEISNERAASDRQQERAKQVE